MGEAGRRFVYVPYDQLTDRVGPLFTADPREIGIILVEAPAKAARRPYHKQKLAYVLANQRHFALEQAARGVAVRYVATRGGYADALQKLMAQLGTVEMMEAAERELRVELAPLVTRGLIHVRPHEGWLTTAEDFSASVGHEAPWRMDAFYKYVRSRLGILMDGPKPIGGKYSFDAENRKPWRGDPPAPQPPKFSPDPVTVEVGDLIATHFAHHPGVLDLSTLPATADDAEACWRWAKEQCLPDFGAYEDAMSTRSSGLFHTRISPLLNLHRVLPKSLVEDVANEPRIPLASQEGFIRQILGWREFVRHLHRETDGFRSTPTKARTPTFTQTRSASPTQDGGFGRWRGEPWPPSASRAESGAAPSVLGAHEPLPGAYWGDPSGLHCLDQVVHDVWQEGWSHHITRLMVLSNLATLLGFEPRELTDWFWVAYIDAYDWVVEPNVLAMGTYGTGDVMTTKPYISGAAYIDRMSDYCKDCAFDPKKNCPITRLYWAFLAEHAERFGKNPRTSGPVRAAQKRAPAERAEDLRVRALVRLALEKKQILTPLLVQKPSGSLPLARISEPDAEPLLVPVGSLKKPRGKRGGGE